VIAPFHNVQFIRSDHFRADSVEQRQRAERVTRSLHEKYGCSDFPKNSISKFARIASTAKWIAQAHKSGHRFLQRDVAADS
jgi:hypothetical protein